MAATMAIERKMFMTPSAYHFPPSSSSPFSRPLVCPFGARIFEARRAMRIFPIGKLKKD